MLLLSDHLHADVAVEVNVIDVGLRLERGDIFLDVPRLVEVVGVLQLHDVIVIIEGLRDFDAEHVTKAAIAQIRWIGQILRIDQNLLATVLEEQVELGDGLVLVAMGVVDASFDAAEEAAAAEILPQGQIARGQGLLDVRRLFEAVMTPAAPRRAVAERHLIGVGVIQAESGEFREIGLGNLEIVAVEGPGLGRSYAISAVGLDVCLVALVRRIGKVGEQVGTIGNPEVVVQPRGEKVIGALVIVKAKNRNDIVDVA